jgi:cyclohexanone monooxygenase
MANSPLSEAVSFDPVALRQRYAQERDKRIRSDGLSQYIPPEGDFKHYVDDPYVKTDGKRRPVEEYLDVAVIGGGFGGVLTGAYLRKSGVKSIRIIEKAGGFGGVWYWNRYPGVACDMEAYVYLPMLEETGYVPPKRYVVGQQIRSYVESLAKRFALDDTALLQTEVASVSWDQATARWIIRTDRGDTLRARFVCHTNGTLSRPKLPGIPGIDRFEGHTFHTSRWDYAYTGGNEDGGLDRLAGKAVGIIGTGATAIQCVPHLAEGAKHLYVFQRTPSSVDVRSDYPTDVDWFRSQAPGWQKERRENFNMLLAGGVAPVDLVNDGWTAVGRMMSGLFRDDPGIAMSPEKYVLASEMADFRKMEELRHRVDSIVRDPQTAERLKPYYRQFCKRPCFHNEYLPTFNRANVTLVDTGGQGVRQINEKGVVVDGSLYPLDCLIFSTGFETGTSYSQRAGYTIVGRDGLRLDEKWKDGVSTLHGMSTRGFPNAFFLSNFQSGFALNYTHTLDEEARHVAYIVAKGLTDGARTIEPTQEAEQQWVETIVAKSAMVEEFLAGCTPGYYNDEGRVRERSRRNAWYGGGSPEFFKLIADWREAGTLEGMDIVRNQAPN